MSGRLRARAAIVATFITALIIVSVMPAIAYAQEEPSAMLVIKPSNYDGSFFDLVVEPGERLDLAVEIGNTGSLGVEALTYAADGFTQVNGGLGIEDPDAQKSGATLWSNFPTRSVALEPGIAIVESFQVTVPADVQPGDYITALVVQANPSQLETEPGVTITQVLRQAITIKMTIPGPAESRLAIGGAEHSLSGGNSVVTVGLQNTGTRTLTPSGTFRLYDADGIELTEFPIGLGKIYAQRYAAFEVPFTSRLNPGQYTVSVTLADDERNLTAEATGIPLFVEADAEGTTSDDPTAASVTQTSGSGSDNTGTGITQASDGLPQWALFGTVGIGLLAGVALAIAVSAVRRRRRAPAAPQPVASGLGDD